MNLMSMMKQAQNLQKKIQEVQKELEEELVVKDFQNGAVTVTCNGQGRFKSIKLTAKAINPANPESVDADTVEMLEDLINEAVKSVSDEAREKMEKKMKSLLPAGINLPGLM
ncbi:YbaB/EbfC family nucleoid-associated protein [bacterium]|nr:YbaB/EbfC family nucleoid-associated protein [bacterium]